MNERYEAIYAYISGITKKNEILNNNSLSFLVSWMLGISDIKTCKEIEFLMKDLDIFVNFSDVVHGSVISDDYLFEYNFKRFTYLAQKAFIAYGLSEDRFDIESELIKIGVYASNANTECEFISGHETILNFIDKLNVYMANDSFINRLDKLNPAKRISLIKAYDLTRDILSLNGNDEVLVSDYTYFKNIVLQSGYYSLGSSIHTPTIDFMRKWGFEHLLRNKPFSDEMTFDRSLSTCVSDLDKDKALILGLPYNE